MEQTTHEWEEWLEEHGPALVLLARQWCANAADAEDAVQEGFMKFWASRKKVRDPRSFLFVCVRNAAYDYGRSSVSRRLREQSVGGTAAELTEPPLFETMAERDERRQAIESAINGLPVEQAEVVTMKLWGNMTFAQIAEAVDASANTVASRYRYALAALRKTLNEEAVR